MLTGQTWQVEVVSRATAHWVRYKLHGSFLMSDVHNRAGRWSALSGCNLNPTKHTTLAKCNTGCRQESSRSNTSSQISKDSFKIWFCFYAPARKLGSGKEIQKLCVPISTLYTTGVPGLLSAFRTLFMTAFLQSVSYICPHLQRTLRQKRAQIQTLCFPEEESLTVDFRGIALFFFNIINSFFYFPPQQRKHGLHEEQKKHYQNTGAAQLPSVRRDFKVDFDFFGNQSKVPKHEGHRRSSLFTCRRLAFL